MHYHNPRSRQLCITTIYKKPCCEVRPSLSFQITCGQVFKKKVRKKKKKRIEEISRGGRGMHSKAAQPCTLTLQLDIFFSSLLAQHLQKNNYSFSSTLFFLRCTNNKSLAIALNKYDMSTRETGAAAIRANQCPALRASFLPAQTGHRMTKNARLAIHARQLSVFRTKIKTGMTKKREGERKDILSAFGPCSLASCTPHLPSVLVLSTLQ